MITYKKLINLVCGMQKNCKFAADNLYFIISLILCLELVSLLVKKAW